MKNYKITFNRMFSAEMLKLKHSAIWLVVIGIPVVSVLIGSGNYVINQAALHGNPWSNFWTQVALFYGYFFYPLAVSVIAAYLWRLEHAGTNWNLVKTLPANASTIWFTNLLTQYLFALLTQSVMLLSYFLVGKFILKLSGPVPPNLLWNFIAGPIFVMASGSIQLYISLRVKSFAAPVAFCFFCCFVGLYLYTKGFWIFPNTLAIIGINAQHTEVPSLIEIIKTFAGTVFWIAVSSLGGIRYLSKKEM